jgi:hypothetical protein
MHAAVAHVHAIDDGITQWLATLDDSPAHESDIIVHQRACQHVPWQQAYQARIGEFPVRYLAAHPPNQLFTRFPNLFTAVIQPSRRHV